MAGRSVDVSLRIKAQDEASKALDAVGKALKDLGGAQAALAGGSSGVGKFVESLSKNVDGLSTLFKKLDTTLAGTNRAYESQARQLASVNSSIIDRKRRIEELTKAEADLQRIQGSYKTISPAKQASFVGPVPPRLTQVRTQLGTETNTLAKEEASLTRLIGKIAEARDANQQIRSVQGQVATAINTTTTAFIEQANALDRLSASEKRAAQDAVSRQQNQALANRVAAVTGTGRTGTPESLRSQRQIDLEKTFAPVFAAEDAAALKGSAQTFDPLQASAKEAAAAMQQIQKYARDVAESLDPVARVTRKVAEEQTRLSAAVNIGALSQSQAATALQKYKQNLEGTANTTDKQGREFEELSNYVDEMRRDFDRAGYAQAFLTRETAKLDRALKLNIIDMNQYGKALESVKRKSEQLGDKSNPSILGLNPYQTQNLMFQFNDIATQLASGSSITQTLAQQGGQILQLFPKVGNAIIGAFAGAGPQIAVVAGVLGGLVLGISRAVESAERLRVFDSILTSNADGAKYSAELLNNSVKRMRELGIATEDAMKIIRLSIKSGFDQDQIVGFADAARGLGVILGTDVTSGAQTLADALDGGYDSLAALDKQTNIFTASELELIRTLFEQGDATRAVATATEILNGRLSDAAENAEGPWQKAFRDLTSAWNGLLDSLANTGVIQGAVSALAALASGAKGIVDSLSGTQKAIAGIGDGQKRINELMDGGLRDKVTFRNGKYELKPEYQSDTTTKIDYGQAFDNAAKETVGTMFPVVKPFFRSDNTPAVTTTNKYKDELEELNKVQASIDKIKKTEDERRAKNAREIQDAVDKTAATKAVTNETEKQIQLAKDLARINREVSEEFSDAKGFTNADRERVAQARLNKQVEEYGKQIETAAKARGRAADEAKREANEAMRIARENLRGATNEGLVATAQKYSGFNENNAGQRAGLMDFFKQSGVNVDPKMVAWCAAFVNSVLGANGLPQTGSLAARSFVDYGKDTTDNPKKGDIVVLKRGPDPTKGHVGFFMGYDKDGNIIVLGGNQAGSQAVGQQSFKAKDVLSIRRAPTQGDVAFDEAVEQNKSEKALVKYNESLDEKLRREERSIENQRALVGLQGEALRAEIERQTVAEQIAQATDDLRRTTGVKDAVLDPSQIDRITVDVKARLKLDEPAKVAADLQKQVSDLEASRGLLESKLQEKQSRGDVGGMRDVQQQIDDIDARIAKAAQSYLDFLNTPGNADALGLYGVELDNMIAKFSQLSQKTAEWKLEVGSATISASEFANAFTSSAVSALDQFAQAIANGKNAFSSLWDAFRQFAADFLIQIAQMIQKQIIFNLVSGLLKSLAGGLGGAAAAPANSLSGGFSNFNLSSLQFHKGGLVGGGGGEFRSISAAAFNGAARYHSGGIAGLKPNEVPAVLMRGEEVLTRDDPRHMMNGGGGGAGGNVKIVNAFDVGDAVSKGMETRAGEKAILNLVRNNPRAFRAAMGNG